MFNLDDFYPRQDRQQRLLHLKKLPSRVDPSGAGNNARGEGRPEVLPAVRLPPQHDQHAEKGLVSASVEKCKDTRSIDSALVSV